MATYAYICAGNEPGGGYSGDSSLTIVDVTDPTNPTFVGRIGHSVPYYLGGPLKVVVRGSYAYVCDQLNGYLTIIDISDPSSPSFVSSLAVGYLHDVKIVGDYAFVVGNDVSGSDDGLVSIDISDPTSPSITDTIIHANLYNPYSLFIKGNYAYVASYESLYIFDISDPTSLSLVGFVDDATRLRSVDYIIVEGNYAYVSAGDGPDYFTVVDVSTPASPSVVGSLSGSGPPNYMDSPYGLYKVGKYVYVCAWGEFRFNIVDVSDPTAPSLVASLNLGTVYSRRPNDVVVRGNYAYVTVSDGASDANGLLIIDISDPLSMSVVGSLIGSGSPNFLDNPCGIALTPEAKIKGNPNIDQRIYQHVERMER